MQPTPIATLLREESKSEESVVIGGKLNIFDKIGKPMSVSNAPAMGDEPIGVSEKLVKPATGRKTAKSEEDKELNIIDSNRPFEEQYIETNSMIRGIIGQIDVATGMVLNNLNEINNSRTMKNKFKYIGDLALTFSTLAGNKLQAAKELNSTIKTCTDLEFKRRKELNSTQGSDDDNRKMMDMYRMLAMTPSSQLGVDPYAMFGSPAVNGISSNDILTKSTDFITKSIESNPDFGYASYIANMTPEQRAMSVEDDPNIRQVVVNEPETGANYFAYMNISTGEEVLGLPTRNNSYLNDPETRFDFANGKVNLTMFNETYDLIVKDHNKINMNKF